MKKWLSVFVFAAMVFGHASWSLAESNLDAASRLLKEIEQISSITDPGQQQQAIEKFMKRVQGLGPKEAKEINEGLNKLAIPAGNKWWVIMEYPYKNQEGCYVGGYLADNPPQDIKKIK